MDGDLAIGVGQQSSEPQLPLLPVYRPDLSGNERRYVCDCIDSSWISSLGVYIERFEQAACDATGARYALGVCNGTIALHLALHSLGIGPGDEVIDVHLYRVRQHDCANRRDTCVRGVPRIGLAAGPGGRRSADHAAHEGDPSGASVRACV